MRRPGSLRGRLLTGAIAWSIGLFILTTIAFVFIVEAHPMSPAVVHRWLKAPALVGAALACMLLGLFLVRAGLSGVDRVRLQLRRLHDGRESRLTGAYASEVQPLVDDLNALLDQRDQAVGRALARAADLAHGLKTPLAVIAHEADRAAAAGMTDIAAATRQQIDRMRRQIDYQLARTRALSGRASGARCQLSPVTAGLVRTLARLHVERGLSLEASIDDSLEVRGLGSDVEEMLGNLLDNACRWAGSRVDVSATTAADRVIVTVDDDGPGLPEEMWEKVLQRGVRLDESEHSSGLGLAIVRDLAEVYDGSVVLGRSPLGGLRAELTLPGWHPPYQSVFR